MGGFCEVFWVMNVGCGDIIIYNGFNFQEISFSCNLEDFQ